MVFPTTPWNGKTNEIRRRFAPETIGPFPAVAYVEMQRAETSKLRVEKNLLIAAKIIAPSEVFTLKSVPRAPWHTLFPDDLVRVKECLAEKTTLRTQMTVWGALRGVMRAATIMGMYSAGLFARIDAMKSPGARRRLPKHRTIFVLDRKQMYGRCNPAKPLGARDALLVALWDECSLHPNQIARIEVGDLSDDLLTGKLPWRGGKMERDIPASVRPRLLRWLEVRGTWRGPLVCPVTERGLVIHKPVVGKFITRRLSEIAEKVSAKHT